MGTTAKKIIKSAYRKIGVIGSGEDPTTDELYDGMVGLKQMIDSWSTETFMIPFRTREDFTLDGSGSYTIGNGGDFDTVRPVSLSQVMILDAAVNRYSVKPLSLENWSKIGNISITGRPTHYYFERGYPLSTLYFSHIPTDPTVRIWSYKPIEAWAIEDVDLTTNPSFSGEKFPTSSLTTETLTADIEFDMGYENALIFNLAVVMAPDFGKMPSDIVLGLAAKYKTQIKRVNTVIPVLGVDRGLGGRSIRYDVVSGP